jgi:hypothetical protein
MYPVKGSAVLQENERKLVSPRRTKFRQNMAKVKNDESKET